jgi:hypothetical protein
VTKDLGLWAHISIVSRRLDNICACSDRVSRITSSYCGHAFIFHIILFARETCRLPSSRVSETESFNGGSHAVVEIAQDLRVFDWRVASLGRLDAGEIRLSSHKVYHVISVPDISVRNPSHFPYRFSPVSLPSQCLPPQLNLPHLLLDLLPRLLPSLLPTLLTQTRDLVRYTFLVPLAAAPVRSRHRIIGADAVRIDRTVDALSDLLDMSAFGPDDAHLGAERRYGA